jgi:cytochrome c-type biogenesis protein CcmF
MGLNPNLQDVALSIHPPFLFLGFGLTGSLWSLAAAYFYTSKRPPSPTFLPDLRKKILILWSILTLGLIWGAWWAYTELGWGSFWFWDPVENIGLLPWILVTLLVHVFYGSEKEMERGLQYSLMIYPCLLFSTWCVRSGLLTSVHSFALNPSRSFFLFLIMLLFFSISFSFAWFSSQRGKGKWMVNRFIRRGVKVASFVFFWIFIGTFLPFFFDLHFGTLFYNPWVLPSFLFFIFFSLSSLMASSKRNRGGTTPQKSQKKKEEKE